MNSVSRNMVRLMFVVPLLALRPLHALACPFCEAPSLTLSEQIDRAACVRLLELESRPSVRRSSLTAPSLGRFHVIDEFIPASDDKSIRGKVATETEEHQASGLTNAADDSPRFPVADGWRTGDLFVVIEHARSSREAIVPLKVSRSGWRYVKAMPPQSDPTPDRLRFFVRYLEHPDALVAGDAYGEFANAPYEDIVAIRDALQRRRLRQWILDSRTSGGGAIQTRLGLYGMLLGLCGESSDANLLKRVTIDDWTPDDGFRLGVDGMMGGYLLLTGEIGLDVIDRTRLANHDTAFSETYAAMQALRFVWKYGDGVINRDRLRKSMRLLLNRPELTDLVIADLARWQDWEIQPRLMQMYDQKAYQVPAIKRAIVRFMLASIGKHKAKPSGSETPGWKTTTTSDSPATEPAHVTRGRTYLASLRARDPQTVSDCERFFLLK